MQSQTPFSLGNACDKVSLSPLFVHLSQRIQGIQSSGAIGLLDRPSPAMALNRRITFHAHKTVIHVHRFQTRQRRKHRRLPLLFNANTPQQKHMENLRRFLMKTAAAKTSQCVRRSSNRYNGFYFRFRSFSTIRYGNCGQICDQRIVGLSNIFLSIFSFMSIFFPLGAPCTHSYTCGEGCNVRDKRESKCAR